LVDPIANVGGAKRYAEGLEFLIQIGRDCGRIDRLCGGSQCCYRRLIRERSMGS
jgi:hypothetical protein